MAIWRLCFIDLVGRETWRNASGDKERARVISEMSRLGAALAMDVDMDRIDERIRDTSPSKATKVGSGNGNGSGVSSSGNGNGSHSPAGRRIRSEKRRRETLFNRFQGKST